MSKAFPVKSMQGYYVTDNGDIYSRKTGRFKKLVMQKKENGYLFVQLRHDGQTKIRLVHRLVAETFIPNPDNKPEVNHINGIKTDNRVENLEWATHSENQKHRFDKLGQRCCWYGKYGADNPFSRGVIQIKGDVIINVFACSREAAEATGIDASQIRAACRGKLKTCHGYQWQYKTRGKK